MKHISYCPLCGDPFDQADGTTDSRYPSGYECETCDEMLEIAVTQFPVA